MTPSHTPTAQDKQLAATLYEMLLSAVLCCRAQSTLSGKVLAVLRCVRAMGLEIIRLNLEAEDEPFRTKSVVVPCPQCNRQARKAKKLEPRQRFTLLGKITYRRCRYRCSTCDHSFSPLDERLDLDANHRGHSREFVSELVLLCTVVPYERGCELFQRLCGFAVSHPLAYKLALSIGMVEFDREMQQADLLWEKRHFEPELFEPTAHQLRSHKRARRLYVMLDNSKLGMQPAKRGRKAPRNNKKKKNKKNYSEQGHWRDARALVIFSEDALAESQSGKRRMLLERRVVAHIGSNEQWYKLAHKAFYEEGVYWAHELVVVADGGNGLWELIDELLPSTQSRRVVQILDWYHACSHLWETGKLLKGTNEQGGPNAACGRWVHKLLEYLKRGDIANVLQRLKKIKGAKGKARKSLDQLIGYFEKHRHRLRYGWFRKHGMLIGSGAIESVHKWVIQARCRLPGMRWSLQGANAMLRLRCAWASGRWDEIFESERSPPKAPARQIKLAA